MAEDAKATHNLPKPEDINDCINRIENLDADIETSKSQHMARCKEIRADKKEVFKEAKAAGIDVTALTAKIKKRALERQIEKVVFGLEGDQYAMFEHIEEVVDGKTGTPPPAENGAGQEAAAPA